MQIVVFVTLAISPSLATADDNVFPETLTLSVALSMLDESHPAMLEFAVSQAVIAEDQARLDARMAVKAGIRLELRAADKSITSESGFIDDSRSILFVDQPITEFGRNHSLNAVLQSRQDALAHLLDYGQSSMRLAVMDAFFDTLISDYAYAATGEEMTLAFLAFEDTEQELELGEATEIQVMEKQALYLELLAAREQIAGDQRSNRLRLALALNRTTSSPSQLASPDLTAYERPLPEYETVIEKVMTRNPLVQSLRLQLETTSQELDIRAGRANPTLGLRFQAADYARNFSTTRDTYRASIYLDIPLTNNRDKQVDLAELSTDILQYQARLGTTEHALRINVLELTKRLQQLEIRKQAAEAELLYRELELDKVRTQYEMEMRARIGRANTMIAKALTNLARVNFDIVMTWEQLDALVGNQTVEIN